MELILCKRGSLAYFFENIQKLFNESKTFTKANEVVEITKPSVDFTTDKLFEITDKELLQNIKPLLKKNKVLEAVEVCTKFYRGKYNSMNFKDWFKLLNVVYMQVKIEV